MRLRTCISIVIALLFAVGPLLQYSVAAEAPSDEAYCGCCQGPCEGCCCADPVAPETETGAGCQCEISALPALPQLPMEVLELRVDNQPTKHQSNICTSGQSESADSHRPLALDNSPPDSSPPPAYLLFGALLI